MCIIILQQRSPPWKTLEKPSNSEDELLGFTEGSEKKVHLLWRHTIRNEFPLNIRMTSKSSYSGNTLSFPVDSPHATRDTGEEYCPEMAAKQVFEQFSR